MKLAKVLPGAVLKSKTSEWGVFRIDEEEVEECNVLGIVQQSAARCTWYLSVSNT